MFCFLFGTEKFILSLLITFGEHLVEIIVEMDELNHSETK